MKKIILLLFCHSFLFAGPCCSKTVPKPRAKTKPDTPRLRAKTKPDTPRPRAKTKPDTPRPRRRKSSLEKFKEEFPIMAESLGVNAQELFNAIWAGRKKKRERERV